MNEESEKREAAMRIKRQTIQRKLALDAVTRLGNHPTVEDVYGLTRKEHPSVSKATVYRNLAQLAREGVIRQLCLPDSPVRYDSRTDPHFHFRCDVCGRLTDVDMDYHLELDKFASEMTGMNVLRHEIFFGGTCPECEAALAAGTARPVWQGWPRQEGRQGRPAAPRLPAPTGADAGAQGAR
jgi:Fe2+ or Zn2+ uptake regulation protein